MSPRRRLSVALCLSILALSMMPGISLAAGHRPPSRLVHEGSVLVFVADWALRAWEAMTGTAPGPYHHLSGASGFCIDPTGTNCAPAPPTNVSTPPPTGTDG
jgi:hypothetical protein